MQWLLSATMVVAHHWPGRSPETVEWFIEIQEKQKMIRRFPLVTIAATILALSLAASASMAGDGQLGQVAEELKTALAADPVQVTQKGASVMLTSSADAMLRLIASESV